MVKWTLYDQVTGAVLRTGHAANAEQANLQATGGGKIVLQEVDPATQAIDPATGLPIARQPMKSGANATAVDKTTITANGVDAVTITNIPSGAKYDVRLPPNLGLVQPPDATVTDGTLILTTTVAGAYTVILSYQNFLDFTVNFNAN